MRSSQRSPGSFTCESAEISFGSVMSHLHVSPFSGRSVRSSRSGYLLRFVGIRGWSARIRGPKVALTLAGGKSPDGRDALTHPGEASRDPRASGYALPGAP